MIHRIREGVTQSWYADDASASGTLPHLRSWWDKLQLTGPQFGYFPNPDTTWLVVKPVYAKTTEEQFQNTGIKISVDRQRHLGAAIGSQSFVKAYVSDKVAGWISKVERLSSIAKSQKHSAYAVFTHGLSGKWAFIMRITSDIEDGLQPLEDAIRYSFLPALTGRQAFSDAERELLALPARHGGLGILNPTKSANSQFDASTKVSKPLVLAHRPAKCCFSRAGTS